MGVVTYVGPGHSVLVNLSGGGTVSVTAGVATTLDDSTCLGLLITHSAWWQADDQHTQGLVPVQAQPFLLTTSPVALQGGNVWVEGDATAGVFAINLPDASTLQQHIYYIKNVGSANAVTLMPLGGDTIDGLASLALNPAQATTVFSDGSTWRQLSTVGGGLTNPMTTSQDLIVAGAAGSPARLGVGVNGQVLTVSTGTVGWANAPSGFTNPMTASQDLIVGGTGGAATRLGVGGNGNILSVTAGVVGWVANPSLTNPMTTAGDIITGGTSGALQRLGIGSTNQVLTVVSGNPTWAAATGGGGTPTIVSPGNLGATYTLTLSSTETWLIGTLNANNALTISGLTAGYSGYLLLTQDVTGGRTLSINGTSIPISATASVTSALAFEYDGTNLYVTLDGGSGGSGGGGGFSNPMTASQDLIVGGTSGAAGRLGVGANSQVLTVTAGTVGWANASSGFSNPMTTAGDIITATTGGSAQRLAIGANGKVLTVTSGAPAWATLPTVATNGVNILDYGAVGNGKQVTDAAITAATATLSSTQAAFTSTDVGKLITVGGAGTGGFPLATTISSVSAGVATLAANAVTTVSGATAHYGTDDTTALANAMAAAGALSGSQGAAIPCVLPSGYSFMVKTKNHPVSGVYLWMYGATILLHCDTNSSTFNTLTATTVNTFGIFGGTFPGTGTENLNQSVWNQSGTATCNNLVFKDMVATHIGTNVMNVTGTSILIENNQFLNCNNNPLLFVGGLNTINFGDSSEIIIRGNVVTDSWAGAIAGVYGSVTEAKAIIANNVCIGNSSSPSNISGSIDLEIAVPAGTQTTAGFTIVGNDVDHRGNGTGTSGGAVNISIGSGNYIQVLIAGNRLQSFNKAVRTQSSDCLITGNILRAPTPISTVSGATPTHSNNSFTAGPFHGRATLVAGTVTVSTPEVIASDNILLTVVSGSGTRGMVQVGTITAGTSFVINSIQPGTASTLQTSDTSTVFWKIDH